MRDVRGADRTKRELSIHDNERLPGACYECAVATDRRSKVRCEKYDENDPAPTRGAAVALGILGLFTGLFGGLLLRVNRTKRTMTVEVHIPHCPDCARHHGTPEPRHVDFEGLAMTFVVHKKFRRAVLRERNPESDPPTA